MPTSPAAMRLTVVEPFRSIFYTPQFVALHRGEFAAEGLDITVTTAAEAGGTVRALLDGSADLALGGIMRSLELADRTGQHLPHFAEVNSRNGFFLLAREPMPRFEWSAVTGKTVISFAGAPTPYHCMLTVLRRHGVDPARVTFVRDLLGDAAVKAFRAGQADFLEVGEPATEELIAEGGAHLVASMGEATGPVPFSSYMATPERLRRDPETLVRFTRAFHRGQRWMARASAAEIAEVIAPAFPAIPSGVREQAVARYHRQGTWGAEPVITRTSFEYLQEILLAGGFIRSRHRYEDLIDTTIAQRAVQTLGATS
jgi:NitT/TauT family transport system substrate-binding protein